jgi:hypothetical protein
MNNKNKTVLTTAASAASLNHNPEVDARLARTQAMVRQQLLDQAETAQTQNPTPNPVPTPSQHPPADRYDALLSGSGASLNHNPEVDASLARTQAMVRQQLLDQAETAQTQNPTPNPVPTPSQQPPADRYDALLSGSGASLNHNPEVDASLARTQAEIAAAFAGMDDASLAAVLDSMDDASLVQTQATPQTQTETREKQRENETKKNEKENESK